MSTIRLWILVHECEYEYFYKYLLTLSKPDYKYLYMSTSTHSQILTSVLKHEYGYKISGLSSHNISVRILTELYNVIYTNSELISSYSMMNSTLDKILKKKESELFTKSKKKNSWEFFFKPKMSSNPK